MQKYLLPSFFIWIFYLIPFAGAIEGYIGENPGFDFYSKIDEGTYKIQQKLVSQKLQKSTNFSTFGRGCPGIKILENAPTDEKVLVGIESQNYAGLSNLLKGKTITTDQFQGLVACLSEKYAQLKSDIAKEQSARETVASIGLYADGDKSNSDYDIIYDIQKINEIIFSTEIKYNGTKNLSSKSLQSLLAGNSPSPLLSSTASIMTPLSSTVSVAAGTLDTDGDGIPDSPTPPATLSSLVGDICTSTGTSGPVDVVNDDAFLQELASIMNGGTSAPVTSGYSASDSPVRNNSGITITARPPAPTNANDFFHTMPCQPGTMFCIDVKTVPGGTIKLGGGKNVSIEGILDKFAEHLLPISESSLAYQKMTNNAGSFPIKNLQLWKSIGGLRVYLGNQPQPTRRDKGERPPSQEEAELKAVIECGYISAGLPTNMAQANSVGGAGYAGRGTTTDIKSRDIRPLGVQESISTAKLSGCMNEYMREGRQTYYNSLSTDLTEIQAFTMSMVLEIRDIMTILSAMDDKPVK